jgi:hypothetical protein
MQKSRNLDKNNKNVKSYLKPYVVKRWQIYLLHLRKYEHFTALEALIYTGRIAGRTASCYMLPLLESILFGPELLSARFFDDWGGGGARFLLMP